ncbi:hypothetical protein A2U01_0036130, partial [Trifolium medium]|nr:hypothetical protein [Trifolium medium]
MYDSEGTPLFPFYWTGNPRAIKGVHDAQLTPFEKETVAFLNSLCRLDIKELLQRETDVDSIIAYLKRMRTINEDDWLSYLAKSKQKKLEPEAFVRPDVQLIVGETDGAKGIVDLQTGGSQPSSLPPKGGRTLRSRTTTLVQTVGEDSSSKGGVSSASGDIIMEEAAGNTVS